MGIKRRTRFGVKRHPSASSVEFPGKALAAGITRPFLSWSIQNAAVISGFRSGEGGDVSTSLTFPVVVAAGGQTLKLRAKLGEAQLTI